MQLLSTLIGITRAILWWFECRRANSAMTSLFDLTFRVFPARWARTGRTCFRRITFGLPLVGAGRVVRFR